MALEGTFQDMSLIDLFQIFVMGNKSGVLVVRQAALCGVVYVLDGKGHDALVLRPPERNVIASGEQAVLDMLSWTDGRFVFRHDLSVEHRPARITHDWEWLEQAASHPSPPPSTTAIRDPESALSGTRAPVPSAPSAASAHVPLPSSTMPQLSPDAPLHLMPRSPSSARTIKFNVDEWRVLSWIAQGASARQIATTTGCELAHIFAVVNELYVDGFVTMLPMSADVPMLTKSNATTPRSKPLNEAVLPERRLVEAVMRRIRGV